MTAWLFIIGFPNPVFTDHPANLSVIPESLFGNKEDKQIRDAKRPGLRYHAGAW